MVLPLVKEFEGCRLSAYPDPETGAEPWTIGWGSTTYNDGAPVKRGDRISQELSDALLAGRLNRDALLLAQRIPGWAELGTNQQAALLSFTYNCGLAWFGSQSFTTLTKVLQAGELEKLPAALMLYVNPGGPSEAGPLAAPQSRGRALECFTHSGEQQATGRGRRDSSLHPAGGRTPVQSARFSPAGPTRPHLLLLELRHAPGSHQAQHAPGRQWR